MVEVCNQLDYYPQPAIESICQTLLDQKDYRTVLRLMMTSHRYRDLCQLMLHQRKRELMNQPPTMVDPDGTQKWMKDGKLHRGFDQPAVIRSNGCRACYQH